MNGTMPMKGSLHIEVHRARRVGLGWKLRNLPNLLRGLIGVLWAQVVHACGGWMLPVGRLYLRKMGADGLVTDYGLVSTRVVTTAFCTFLAAQLITDSTAIGDFKYHEFGTGTGNEAVGDTSLTFSTEMVGDVRATGTQVQGASAVAYKSVATATFDGTGGAITEHGVFNDTRANGGTLMDRSKFAAINVVAGDSITATYELTLTAGG
jgi:hypothetical protein